MSALGSAWRRVRDGATVTLRPRGTSMSGLIEDGDTVVVAPCDPATLTAGDAVLVRVKGRAMLHKVLSVDGRGRLLIGNNRGHRNGWVQPSAVAGIAVSVNGVTRPRTDGKVPDAQLTRRRSCDTG